MHYPEAITHGVIFPGEELKDFVSHFWFSRWNTGIQSSINYHSTATTSTELVFAFDPDRQPVFSSLQGHTSHYKCIQTGGFSEMFGVSLYSHAIPYFFDVSAGELVNQLVELREIMCQDTEAMAHRLADTTCFQKRIALFSHYLSHKLDPNRRTDLSILHAIKKIRALKGQITIEKLAKESFLSQKQFERRFKNFSGFNPKLYCRILRFENALSPLPDDGSFTSGALDLGYYDQSHFINDFREFSGFSPAHYIPVSS